MTRRSLVELLLALAAAAALDALLPPFAAAGLRATLAFAPIPLALFAAVARAAPRGRARPAEHAALVAWVLAALGHDRLGLPESAPLVAAFGLLLMGARTLRLALALAPRLRRREAPLDLLPFVLLPAAVYLAMLPWASAARAPNGDEPYYLLLAHSIAEDLDVDLADEYREGAWRSFSDQPVEPQPGDPTGPAGEIYSRHEPALPLLLAPAYAAAGRLGAQLVMVALTALAAGRLLAAARRQPGVGPRGALAAWGLFAFAPPLPLYSHQVWVEVPAALLLLLAIEARLDLRASAGAASWRSWLRFALPLAALPLLKLRLLAVAAPLALLALAGLRRQRRLQVSLVALFALVVAAILTANQLAFGNPLKMHSVEDLALGSVPLEQFLRGGVGLGFDLAFGLLAAAPLWLLALPAVARVLWRLEPITLELAALAPYLLLTASRREWYGGFSPPFRYGLVLLPIVALAIARLLARRPPAPARTLIAALAALSLPLALVWLALPEFSYHLADGSNHPLDRLSARHAVDLLRFLPSAVRPSAATWLVPLALAALALAAFASRARRPRRAWTAGVAAALALWPALLVASHRLPTRVVELEDPWIAHRGALPYPERWVLDRTLYRGGRILPEGAEAAFVPVPGGRQVEMAVEWSYIRNVASPLALELWADDRLLARLRPGAPGVWQRTQLGPFPWRKGSRLRLVGGAPEGSAPVNGLVVDRLELAWR